MDKVYKEKWKKTRFSFILAIFACALLLLANFDYHQVNKALHESNISIAVEKDAAEKAKAEAESKVLEKEAKIQELNEQLAK